MSLGSIAFQTPSHLQRPLAIDPRLQVNAGNRAPYFSTMFKVGTTAAALFISIGSFFLFAPIVAIAATVVSCGTAGLFWLFDSCCGGRSDDHDHRHIRVGDGDVDDLIIGRHREDHVEVGGGHRGWGFPFPFFGGGERAHVEVGGGHTRDHVEVGGGHRGGGFPFFGGGAGDHVEVGGGHTRDHVEVGGGHRGWGLW
jgi:hypothetical protein